MERRRTTLILLFISCLLVGCFFPNKLYAEQSDADLYPSGSIESPLYSKYEKEYYQLDQYSPEDSSWSDIPMIGIVQFLNYLLGLGWKLYLFLVELAIRMVNWVFDPTMLDKLFDLLSNLMPNIINNVWKPLWFLVAVLGIAGAVLIWSKGDTNRSFLSIGTIVLLVAFVPAMLVYMPTVLSKTNAVVTQMGAEIMKNMISTEIKKVELQIKDLQKEELEKKATSKSETGTGNQATKKTARYFDPWNNQVLAGIHAIDDSIWKSLVVQPYWIANFGSVQLGQAKWMSLLDTKDNQEKRKEWLKINGKIQSNGTTDSNEYKIFTIDGFGERFYKTSVVVLLTFIPLVVIMSVAIIVLIWKARAIGRTVFLVFDYLMALYPGYGISAAIQATVRVLTSFLMVFFYTVALACFLALWTKIQDPTVFKGATFGDRILLILILLFGLWAGVQGVQRRISNIPGLFGGSTQAGESQNDLGIMRRMVTMSAIKGTSNLVGKPVGKMWGVTKKYALKKPATFVGQQIGKQARKGITKAGQYVGNIDAVHIAKGKLNFLNPKAQTLTANLSKNASDTYQKMVKKRYKPTNEESRKKFIKQHPDLESHVHEIEDWIPKSDKNYYAVHENPILDGSMIPPRPPRPDTPEYLIWSSTPKFQEHWDMWTSAEREVRQKRNSLYQEQKKKYDKSIFRRLFTQRPIKQKIDDRECLRKYRKLIEEKKER